MNDPADPDEKPRPSPARLFLRIVAVLVFSTGIAAWYGARWFERHLESRVELGLAAHRFTYDSRWIEDEAAARAWNADGLDEFARRTETIAAQWYDGDFADRPDEDARVGTSLSRAFRALALPDRALKAVERSTRVCDEARAASGGPFARFSARHLPDESAYVEIELERARANLEAGDRITALEAAWSALDWAVMVVDDSSLTGVSECEAWRTVGETQRALGDFAGARVSFESALEVPEDAPSWMVIDVEAAAADVLERLGERAAALDHRRRALKLAERTFDVWDPRVARRAFELGVALAESGPSARGEAILHVERSLASRRESACGDSRGFADHVLLAARLLAREGDTQNARARYDEAAPMLARLGAADAATVIAERDALVQAKNQLRAETDRQRLQLEFRERADAPDSPEMVQNLNELGRALRAQGKHRESEPYYRRALEMQQRIVPGDSWGAGTLMNNLGLVRVRLGEDEEGLAQLQEALAMRRRVAQGDHEDVAQSLLNVALVHHKKDEFQRAFELEDEAVAMLKRVRQGDDMDLALAIDNRASTLADLGRVDESIAGHLEALAMERRLRSGDDADVAQTLDELGTMYTRVKRYDDALVVLSEALRMRRRLFDGDHEDIVTTLERLGDVHWERVDAKSALEVRREALAMRRRLVSAPDPDNAFAALECASTYMVLDDERAALVVFTAVVSECTGLVPGSLRTLRQAVEGATRACTKTAGFDDVDEVIESAGRALLASSGGSAAHRSRCFSAISAFYTAWYASAPAPERTAAAERWRAASSAPPR